MDSMQTLFNLIAAIQDKDRIDIAESLDALESWNSREGYWPAIEISNIKRGIATHGDVLVLKSFTVKFTQPTKE